MGTLFTSLCRTADNRRDSHLVHISSRIHSVDRSRAYFHQLRRLALQLNLKWRTSQLQYLARALAASKSPLFGLQIIPVVRSRTPRFDQSSNLSLYVSGRLLPISEDTTTK